MFKQPGPGNTKLGAFGRGLFWWEGRVDALLSDSPKGWNLRSVPDVAMAERAAWLAFADLAGEPIDYGAAITGEVRRYDLAHEFVFEDGREGLAFLRTMMGMCPPRRKIAPVLDNAGQPETVYVRTLKSFVVTERTYDKGLESGSHPRGQRVRFEAQRRPAKTDRYTPAALATLDLRAEFGRSINPYLRGESVIAAGSKGAVVHLAEKAARNEMSITRAERLLGSLQMLGEYGRAVYGDERKARRRIKDLRDAGISLDDELPADRVVPVGQLLADAVESFNA